MDRKSVINIAIFIIAIFALACAGKKDQSSTTASDSKTWKEMDEFHMVMAETFHPYKDSADLEPVKTKANDLVAAADKWANAAMPEKVNNDEMKTKLQSLKSETEALADVIQNGEDQVIGDQLTKVHDLFHEIQEAWYGGGEEHHHEH
jgi:hypothetical protein